MGLVEDFLRQQCMDTGLEWLEVVEKHSEIELLLGHDLWWTKKGKGMDQ